MSATPATTRTTSLWFMRSATASNPARMDRCRQRVSPRWGERGERGGLTLRVLAEEDGSHRGARLAQARVVRLPWVLVEVELHGARRRWL